ncbi:MAG: hypothetical protein DRI44_05625 [Chlamydiae bacterium]|nr:MAG: hypothetical protein DRI44_05625 [Chlamydiota bacterium]
MKWQDYPNDKKAGVLYHDFPKGRCEIDELVNAPLMPMHTHNFDELVFILGGSAVHIIDDEEYPIIRGDVFVVRGNHKHGYGNEKNLHIVNILYQRDFFESLKVEFSDLPGFNALFVHEPLYRKKHKFKSKLHLNSQQLRKISQFLKSMSEEQNNNWAGTAAINEHIFTIIVINVCKFFLEVKSQQPKTLFKISAAIDFIEQNFRKPISNDQLSNIADMTQGSFRYSFKKITGLSPIDYLIRLRIERAADAMAKNSQMRVIDAAFKVGFENSAYFTKKFKKIIGMTPMAYLKTQRSMVD